MTPPPRRAAPESGRRPAWRRLVLAGAALLLSAAGMSAAFGWLLVRPHPARVGAPPAGLAATDIALVTRDGLRLAGWFVRGEPGAGAVLLMHGVRSDRREMAGVATALAREGFSLLLFDFRAEGESDGKRISMGALESVDARAAFDFVRGAAPGEKIGAIGRSMGGAAALLGDGPLPVDALVLESVFPDVEEATATRMRHGLGAIGPKLAPLLLWQLRPWLGIGPEQLRPVAAVARLRAPLLVLVGDRDRYLPVDHARAVFDAAPEPKEFWVVAGADHEELRRVQPEEYDRRVLLFLKRWLR